MHFPLYKSYPLLHVIHSFSSEDSLYTAHLSFKSSETGTSLSSESFLKTNIKITTITIKIITPIIIQHIPLELILQHELSCCCTIG